MKSVKAILFSAMGLIFSQKAGSQNLTAAYKIDQVVKVPLNLEKSKEATINFTAYLFKKDRRYIYFEKPDYINTYPQGKISIQISEDKRGSYLLNMDTLQAINYCSYDSLLFRYRQDFLFKEAANIDRNISQLFEPDYYPWAFHNETKTINGLLCQKATLTMSGNLNYEVWFCKDIETSFNIDGIIGIPGLIVEATRFDDSKHFLLLNYTSTKAVADAVFWPNEFNEKFVLYPMLKKSKIKKEKSKLEKQTEISNNNQ